MQPDINLIRGQFKRESPLLLKAYMRVRKSYDLKHISFPELAAFLRMGSFSVEGVGEGSNVSVRRTCSWSDGIRCSQILI